MKIFIIMKLYTGVSVGGTQTPLTPVGGIIGFAPIAATKEEAIAFCGVDGQYIEAEILDGKLPS